MLPAVNKLKLYKNWAYSSILHSKLIGLIYHIIHNMLSTPIHTKAFYRPQYMQVVNYNP